MLVKQIIVNGVSVNCAYIVVTMQLNIVKVGNSRGLRFPKAVLDEYQIGETVELKLKDGFIELRPTKDVRKDWKSKLAELSTDPNEEERIPDVFEDEEL